MVYTAVAKGAIVNNDQPETIGAAFYRFVRDVLLPQSTPEERDSLAQTTRVVTEAWERTLFGGNLPPQADNIGQLIRHEDPAISLAKATRRRDG